MRFHRMLTTVDSHTAGEPVRAVIGGFPKSRGRRPYRKGNVIRRNLGHLETALLNEPREHNDRLAISFTRTNYFLIISKYGRESTCVKKDD